MVTYFPRSHSKSLVELRLKLYLFEAKAHTFPPHPVPPPEIWFFYRLWARGRVWQGEQVWLWRELQGNSRAVVQEVSIFVLASHYPPFARRQAIDQHQPDPEGKITVLQTLKLSRNFPSKDSCSQSLQKCRFEGRTQEEKCHLP